MSPRHRGTPRTPWIVKHTTAIVRDVQKFSTVAVGTMFIAAVFTTTVAAFGGR